MILADKILSLRKSSGWSQEELAEKINVSRQSISKWESAVSIPDINKILELAKLFGVTTDYLLLDEMESPAYTDSDEIDDKPRLSLKEANAYIDAKSAYGKSTGLGVMICILSPVLLILLAGITDAGAWGISMTSSVAAGVGVIVLLLMIAVAVAILITSSMKMKRFDYLRKCNFELEYGVPGIVNEKRNSFERKYVRSLVVGVVLCILCVVPLILAGLLEASSVVLILLTAMMFVIISVAVYIFISFGNVKSSFDQLLLKGEFDIVEKELNKRVEKLSGIYWPVIVAVYLGYSFITGNWHISWVIWPVAALVFGGISAALRKDS